MPFFDLLKRGVTIQYDEREGIISVRTGSNDFKSIQEVVRLLVDCFGIEERDVAVVPTTVKGYKVRLEFPYSFDGVEIQQEVQTDNHLWYPLTNKAYYRVDEEFVRIGFEKGDRIEPVLKVCLEDLKRLYDNIPDEADSAKIRKLIKEMDIQIPAGFETYIMRVLANYVKFGGEILKEGKSIRFLKDTAYLREENRRKMRQELEVIGTEVG